jgi:hypothetical protein
MSLPYDPVIGPEVEGLPLSDWPSPLTLRLLVYLYVNLMMGGQKDLNLVA